MTNSTEIKRYISMQYPDCELLCDIAVLSEEKNGLASMPKTLILDGTLNIPLVTSLSIAEVLQHGRSEIKRIQDEHPWAFPYIQKAARKIHEMNHFEGDSIPEYVEEKMLDIIFLISIYGVLLEFGA